MNQTITHTTEYCDRCSQPWNTWNKTVHLEFVVELDESGKVSGEISKKIICNPCHLFKDVNWEDVLKKNGL